MRAKDLVLAALHNEETPRVPWVPFVGCHAANLIGVSADRFLQSADLIVQGVEKAIAEYRPDGLPALFDLQLEAEAMGCRLHWSPNNPPAVISHPLEDGKSLADLKIPGAEDGRFPEVLSAVRRICSGAGKDIAIYGLITGPFTLALHLMGTDIFYQMIDEPENVHALMELTTQVNIATARMYLDAGVDIIAVVDPMTSQISPQNFADFVTPYATRVFDFVHENGKPGTFFVCGNARNNIEEMCRCHADGLSIDENIPLDYVRDICRKYGLSFGGNIRLTVTMLFGTPADNVNDAMNCMEIGGTRGFILSPGCDMPFDVPQENVAAISALIHGEIACFMESSDPLGDVTVNLPDYTDPEHVYVDVVTLDSSSCAPCQYMMEAVEHAAGVLGSRIVYQEHKIKSKEGIVAMKELGVTNLPTIVIDGVVSFISVIPDEATFIKALNEAMAKKNIQD
ncbi:MAG: uroporphyrinogen decarboxylase family protein [Bacillota bacterium]|nr:uroporphyrinogen decarboxylase family protein [Bacillota bacterium]